MKSTCQQDFRIKVDIQNKEKTIRMTAFKSQIKGVCSNIMKTESSENAWTEKKVPCTLFWRSNFIVTSAKKLMVPSVVFVSTFEGKKLQNEQILMKIGYVAEETIH